MESRNRGIAELLEMRNRLNRLNRRIAWIVESLDFYELLATFIFNFQFSTFNFL